jgi:dipeptidyl aminopeptidase/acylaminoacyl peptidase
MMTPHPAPRLLQAVILVVLLVAGALPFEADARMKRVAPGTVPELREGEGLVLVAVDSSVPVHAVRVSRNGRQFGAGVMRDLPAGLSFTLYVAPAGEYAFREVDLVYRWRLSLRDDPEFRFRVSAGEITYPGELLYRPRTLWIAEVDIANRALAAIDWLEREHPDVYRRYPLAYSGHYPDPFPAFYLAERGATSVDAALLAPPEPAAPLPLDPALLWQRDRIVDVSLNPAGTLAALHMRGDGFHAIELVDLAARARSEVIRSPEAFSDIEWSGDDRLVLTVRVPDQTPLVTVVKAHDDGNGGHRFERLRLPRRGVVVDVLADQPGHILFASSAERGGLMVHRLDISSQASLDRFRFDWRTRLNAGVSNDIGWITDGSGALRMALIVKDDRHQLVHVRDGQMVPAFDLGEELGFEPLRLSTDGTLLYGLSDVDREQRDVIAYDLVAGKVTATVFTRPGVDIVGPLFDARNEVIGATYYRNGRLVSEYLAGDSESLSQAVQQVFPGQAVATAARSRDGRHSLLWVEAAHRPPTLYHFDATQRRVDMIDDAAPWLAEQRFAPTEVVSVEAVDGQRLEGFLTLPEAEGRRPLVVFPHGGPIGVADRLHFDREVQFLAALGYAVLRVNFRGSDGYGRAFREAGHRNYGRLIEDDVDAAIRHVLATHALDERRICMVGASYGGYSGLVAAVRWPERFRCVVAIAGVTDLALFFTASDGARNARSRKRFEEVIGDPRTGLEEMMAHSPLYQYQRLQVPVMLVHGAKDRRVDFEHARRLQRMLAIAGRPPVGIEFPDAAHSFKEVDDVINTWTAVAGFLQQHLPVDGAKANESVGTEPAGEPDAGRQL